MLSNISVELKNSDFDISSKKVDPDILHAQLRAAISDLDAKGVSLMDFPPEIRRRAFEIEQDITDAVNAGDQAAFDRALKSWQECFD